MENKEYENKYGDQWIYAYLFDEFKNESDRAAVILVASVIDDRLKTLVKMALVPIATSDDPLFSNSNSAISTFSSKVDMSFRLGLISAKLARDIHLIRKIRNNFAHEIFGCNFEMSKVKQRVEEIEKSMEGVDVKTFYELLGEDFPKNTRGKFLILSSSIVYILNEQINQIGHLVSPNDEGIYIKNKK